jgi:hypothetical protein
MVFIGLPRLLLHGPRVPAAVNHRLPASSPALQYGALLEPPQRLPVALPGVRHPVIGTWPWRAMSGRGDPGGRLGRGAIAAPASRPDLSPDIPARGVAEV